MPTPTTQKTPIGKLEEILKPKAREQQLAGLKQNQSTVPQISAKRMITPIETREEIAKAAHVSRDTISKVKAIEDKATASGMNY
jgi:hypothetical protein